MCGERLTVLGWPTLTPQAPTQMLAEREYLDKQTAKRGLADGLEVRSF